MTQKSHPPGKFGFGDFSRLVTFLVGPGLAICRSAGDVEIDLDRNGQPEFRVEERASLRIIEMGNGGGLPIVVVRDENSWAQLTTIAAQSGFIAANRPPPGLVINPQVAGFPAGHAPDDAADDLVWLQEAAEFYRVIVFQQIHPPAPAMPITMTGNFASTVELGYAGIRIFRNSEWYYGWLALRAKFSNVGQVELVAFDISQSPNRRLPMGEIQFETEEQENGIVIRWNPQIIGASLEVTSDLSNASWTTYASDEPGRATIPRTASSPIYFRLRYG